MDIPEKLVDYDIDKESEMDDENIKDIDKTQITNIRKFENCQNNIRSATMSTMSTSKEVVIKKLQNDKSLVIQQKVS